MKIHNIKAVGGEGKYQDRLSTGCIFWFFFVNNPFSTPWKKGREGLNIYLLPNTTSSLLFQRKFLILFFSVCISCVDLCVNWFSPQDWSKYPVLMDVQVKCKQLIFKTFSVTLFHSFQILKELWRSSSLEYGLWIGTKSITWRYFGSADSWAPHQTTVSETWGWSPPICTSTSPLSDSDACYSLTLTYLDNPASWEGIFHQLVSNRITHYLLLISIGRGTAGSRYLCVLSRTKWLYYVD